MATQKKESTETVKNRNNTVKAICEIIESAVPVELQENWDNSGIQIGFPENIVTGILFSLEVDDRVVEEAKSLGANMILCHHPLFFNPIKKIDQGEYKGNLIVKLIEEEISVYASHTPFDKIKDGNNDIIAQKIGLSKVKNLNGDEVRNPLAMIEKSSPADIGRIGKLKIPMSYGDAIKMIADNLNMSLRQLRPSGNLNREISQIAICTGAGADMLDYAVNSGCDLMITGDVKYHQAREGLEQKICVLDAGHYDTEKFFGEGMIEFLEKKLGDKLPLILSKVDFNPFTML